MMIVAMLGKLCPEWDVTQAKDGGDALKKCDQGGDDFEACLIDINMPGINGFKLAEQLREKYPNAHICMLSANVQEKVQQRAADSGYQFLPKPVTSGKLESFIENVQGD